jgi:hypothetical protein
VELQLKKGADFARVTSDCNLWVGWEAWLQVQIVGGKATITHNEVSRRTALVLCVSFLIGLCNFKKLKVNSVFTQYRPYTFHYSYNVLMYFLSEFGSSHESI